MSNCYMVPCHTESPLIIQDPGKGARNTARALCDLIRKWLLCSCQPFSQEKKLQSAFIIMRHLTNFFALAIVASTQVSTPPKLCLHKTFQTSAATTQCPLPKGFFPTAFGSLKSSDCRRLSHWGHTRTKSQFSRRLVDGNVQDLQTCCKRDLPALLQEVEGLTASLWPLLPPRYRGGKPRLPAIWLLPEVGRTFRHLAAGTLGASPRFSPGVQSSP